MYNTEAARQEFKRTLEDEILRLFKNKLKTIFDVGANIGEWYKLAREEHPEANFHLFEIVPDTYKKLLTNITIDEQVTVNSYGLSNELKISTIKWYRDVPICSTELLDLHFMSETEMEIVTNIVATGDSYVCSRNIEYIDFLKIDTEGAEPLILEGFKNTLSNNQIGIIQFEMGITSVLNKFFLYDAYELLKPYGFVLTYIPWKTELRTDPLFEFRSYKFDDDIKCLSGANILAVHKSKLEHYNLRMA